MFRYGIVGCGNIARAHADAISKIPGSKVVGVCDIVADRAESMRERLGCEAYHDLGDMLDRDDMGAVVVCTPHVDHADQCVTAAEAGKHVLCEKPIATTLKDADVMISSCRKASVTLMVGQTHRFYPENVRAWQMIRSGEIGDLIWLSDSILSKPASGWRNVKEKAGGGVFMDNGVHSVDRLRWWGNGQVRSVSARVGSKGMSSEVEDDGIALLRFSDGTYGSVMLSRSTHGVGECVAKIVGTEGVLMVETWRGLKLGKEKWEDVTYDSSIGGIEAEHREFQAAILEGRPPSVTGEEGRENLRVVLAIYESSAKEAEVRL